MLVLQVTFAFTNLYPYTLVRSSAKVYIINDKKW